MEQEGKSIIIAIAVEEGTHANLEPLMNYLKERYDISSIEYGSKKQTSWLKCKLENPIEVEFRKLKEIAMVDFNVSEQEIYKRRCRSKRIVFVRDLISFIFYKRYEISAVKLAVLLGAASHVSILFSCRKFDEKDLDIKTCSLELAYNRCKKRYKKRI